MSHVTFHLSLTATAIDLPLLSSPLSTVDWLQIQKNPKKSWTKNVCFEPIIQIFVLLEYYQERQKIWYFVRYQQTNRHGDSMTDPDPRAESVKIHSPPVQVQTSLCIAPLPCAVLPCPALQHAHRWIEVFSFPNPKQENLDRCQQFSSYPFLPLGKM